nr:MAG TPA: hypothetical protein [Bacteriophage sp.]DAG33531.1 MAG TPA: hypothetical protein [Caudoviricetes sp.]
MWLTISALWFCVLPCAAVLLCRCRLISLQNKTTLKHF